MQRRQPGSLPLEVPYRPGRPPTSAAPEKFCQTAGPLGRDWGTSA